MLDFRCHRKNYLSSLVCITPHLPHTTWLAQIAALYELGKPPLSESSERNTFFDVVSILVRKNGSVSAFLEQQEVQQADAMVI